MKRPKVNPPQKTMMIWLLLLFGLIYFAQRMSNTETTIVKDFNFQKYKQALIDGEVAEVTLYTKSDEARGKIKPEFKEKWKGTDFTIAANLEKAFEVAEKHSVTANYNNEDHQLFIGILVSLLPFILIGLIFFFFMKQLQVGGGKAMNFGKSRARLLNENKKKVTFKDVAGVEEAKGDLVEIVEFLKNPKKFSKLGGKIPRGVLLVGPPGTGKTLMARAVAGEAGVPFFTISGSDFVEMFVGVGASRVRDMFEQGKKSAPCLIFIDEIDAVGRHRGAGMGGGHDEREQTLNQLLVEMDGFDAHEGVIIIAATNRPDVLDPALLRPGRFDRRVIVGKPDLNGRAEILKVHAKKTPLAADVDLKVIARGTPGFTGADLENLVNEAALVAAKYNQKVVFLENFEEAKDKILMGSERRSMVMSDEDKKITAYHEAGHTLIGRKLKGLDPIHKVTIIPRGQALGVTQTLPEKEEFSFTKSKAKKMLSFLFGGRAAEELVLKDITTGASNDIERATDIARKMVTQWGMSENLGPLAFAKDEGPVFLGMQQSQRQEVSDSKAQEIDSEVHTLISEAYALALSTLKENQPALEALAQALLEFETITGKEVDQLIEGQTLAQIQAQREEFEKNKKELNASLDGEASKNKLKKEEESPESTSVGGSEDPLGQPA